MRYRRYHPRCARRITVWVYNPTHQCPDKIKVCFLPQTIEISDFSGCDGVSIRKRPLPGNVTVPFCCQQSAVVSISFAIARFDNIMTLLSREVRPWKSDFGILLNTQANTVNEAHVMLCEAVSIGCRGTEITSGRLIVTSLKCFEWGRIIIRI